MAGGPIYSPAREAAKTPTVTKTFTPARVEGAGASAPATLGGHLGVAAREVFEELERATAKFPIWPTDPLHALAILGEEFGELTKDALQLCYEPHKTSVSNLRAEAIQTAAMALRFAINLDRYEFRAGPQHFEGQS